MGTFKIKRSTYTPNFLLIYFAPMQRTKLRLMKVSVRRIALASKETTAIFLAASFLLSPLQVAFAEGSESPEKSPPAKTTSASPGEGVSDGHKADPHKKPIVTLPLPAQSHATPPGLNAEEAPPSELPPEEEGELGLISEEDPFPFTYERVSHASAPQLTPNESTASFQYTLPIITPPGRHGIEPQLQLIYDSSFTKNEYLGLGWSANIPYIERINRTGAENMYTDDYFVSALDGELRTVSAPIEEMMAGGGEEFLMREEMVVEEGESGGALAPDILDQEGSLSDRVEGTSASERASIKSAEIAKIGPVARTERKNVDIEIVSMNATDGGIEVFSRAWDKINQIGFGTVGTVEIERFRIFNPPILVPDENGTIVRPWSDSLTGEQGEFRYREDLKEALF